MRNIIRWVLTYTIRTVIQSVLYFIYNMCSERRVAVLDKVTDFLLFLGKLLIVGIVGRKTFQNLKKCVQFVFKLNGGWKKNCELFICAGIFSFFFFSGKIKAVEDAAPSLNYYWVPILVRNQMQ